mmetsp:Transcript_9378/g.24254  ORF Transcript_9378/g.24254 Transcript_9378/m.24254 type:complete len:229 (+) Transcript_9378:629-1315(+)
MMMPRRGVRHAEFILLQGPLQAPTSICLRRPRLRRARQMPRAVQTIIQAAARRAEAGGHCGAAQAARAQGAACGLSPSRALREPHGASSPRSFCRIAQVPGAKGVEQILQRRLEVIQFHDHTRVKRVVWLLRHLEQIRGCHRCHTRDQFMQSMLVFKIRSGHLRCQAERLAEEVVRQLFAAVVTVVQHLLEDDVSICQGEPTLSRRLRSTLAWLDDDLDIPQNLHPLR